MRGVLGWIGFGAALAVCLGTAVAAYRLAAYSWEQVVSYESPYLELASRGRQSGVRNPFSGPARARRLVLVIVDGLRLDASERMLTLDGLREYGSDLVAVAPQPSLSFPAWTTILSGATPVVSGVTTNWYEGRVGVETLLDLELAARRRCVVVGPESFDELFDARRAHGVALRDWEGEPLVEWMVDNAVRLAKREDADFVLVHIPDIDEAGHGSGGTSEEYRRSVERVDRGLRRLTESLRSADTAFAVVSDHGHVATGGHGGWEPEVTRTPAVLAGAGVGLARKARYIAQQDLAPTLSALHGLVPPEESLGVFRREVLPGDPPSEPDTMRVRMRSVIAGREDTAVVSAARVPVVPAHETPGAVVDPVRSSAEGAERVAMERRERLPLALGLAALAVAVIAFVGWLSLRALVSVAAGATVYFVVYDGLYFLLHRHRWSLSAFNSEDLVQAFFNARMAEAALAGVLGAAAAALVYPMMRRAPKASVGRYLVGWVSLGPATVLAVQALLALQVAWFLWAYGARVEWVLPDFRWGFKYDLDLVQMTGLGAAAALSPLATYLTGRYHPRVRRAAALSEDRRAA